MRAVRARSPGSRTALMLTAASLIVYLLNSSQEVGWAWTVAVAALAIPLVALGMRSKAPKVEGAMWSGSADLLGPGRRRPGQLSLSAEEATWIPSRYSQRRGAVVVRVALRTAKLDFEAGPAIRAVLIRISPAGAAEPLLFLTNRSRRLTRAALRLQARE